MRRSHRLGTVATVAVMLAACGSADPADDPYLWLEDVHSERADAWVAAENAKTLDVLTKDSRFATNLARAQAIGAAADRIPMPEIHNGSVYNFWRDGKHVHGIWRTTSQADYAAAQPNWTTVLDLDAVAAAEHKNWVWAGANCASTTETRCLVELSDGGEDAHTVREFDLTTKQFVPDGFRLPRGKQHTAWVDDDTVLVTREWRAGELTASGYPYVVKTLRRGRPLERATEVSRGSTTDVGSELIQLVDGQGHRAELIDRGVSFFEHEYRLVTSDGGTANSNTPDRPAPDARAHAGAALLGLPPKSAPVGLFAGRVLVQLDQEWTPPSGPKFGAGTLVSIDLAAAARDPQRLAARLVYAPGPRETLGDLVTTGDRLVLTSYRNVHGRVTSYTARPDGSWAGVPIDVPDNASIRPVGADRHGDAAYLSIASFLAPDTLVRLTGNDPIPVKTMPPKFDASGLVVEQHEATSRDGTEIPYFVVHRADMPLDGANPTILNAYGGFAIAKTPFYDGELGKLWLAPDGAGSERRGGVFVLANIRGGGEFGPAWHEAGLTVRRQRVYDDFAAVAEDLVTRKITTPRRLGIKGGSNGGLLMGVEFTQRPELWRAVDIQVPLLDMMRYEQIAAGASWVGEYGSVHKPDERAFLASISPYQQLRAGVPYPEPLIWTTTKDDRVGPQHARKFAAKLASLGDPYLFYEVTAGGHGAGSNIDQTAFTTALEYTYFERKLTTETDR